MLHKHRRPERRRTEVVEVVGPPSGQSHLDGVRRLKPDERIAVNSVSQIDRFIRIDLFGQGVEHPLLHESHPCRRRGGQRWLSRQMSPQSEDFPGVSIAEQPFDQPVHSRDGLEPAPTHLPQVRPLGLLALTVGLRVPNDLVAELRQGFARLSTELPLVLRRRALPRRKRPCRG